MTEESCGIAVVDFVGLMLKSHIFVNYIKFELNYICIIYFFTTNHFVFHNFTANLVLMCN